MSYQDTALRQNAPREIRADGTYQLFYCAFVLVRELHKAQAAIKMRLFALFALGAFSAFSQPLAFGVKGGAPLSGLLDTTANSVEIATSTTDPYVVGPTVEVRLPQNLAIEFDALFRHFRYQWSLTL